MFVLIVAVCATCVVSQGFAANIHELFSFVQRCMRLRLELALPMHALRFTHIETPMPYASCSYPKTRLEVNPTNATTQKYTWFYRRVASIALSSPTILKLFPLPNFPRIRPAAGISASSQCLNTAFMSRGTPSMTTVVTGMKGLSSSETAKMPYS